MKRLIFLSFLMLAFSCKKEPGGHCTFTNSTKSIEIMNDDLKAQNINKRAFSGIKSVSTSNGKLSSIDYLDGTKEILTYNTNNEVLTQTIFSNSVTPPFDYIKDSNVFDSENHIVKIYNFDTDTGIERIDSIVCDMNGRITKRYFGSTGNTFSYLYDRRGNCSSIITQTGFNDKEYSFYWDSNPNPLWMYGIKGNNPIIFTIRELGSANAYRTIDINYVYNESKLPLSFDMRALQ